MNSLGIILIIEDDADLARSVESMLEQAGYSIEIAPSADVGLAQVMKTPVDVVLTALRLANAEEIDKTAGLDLIDKIHAVNPHLPIILMTAHHTTEIAIEAAQRGAYDYLTKPIDDAYLLVLIGQAVASTRFISQPVEIGQATSTKDALVGNSVAMQTVYKDIGRLADKPVTVLIRGETGTGKELVARAIFQHSDRLKQPFIVVSCVTIPETLLESELFGHEQGAFTGAQARRVGRFEQANHGTIFLDEIGDMTPKSQASLLRVLQEKTIQRLAGKETIPVDVRIIAATHRDLEQAIKDGGFREDLYYRLNVAVITVPPLRDRLEDIPDLARYFLLRHGANLGTPNATIAEDALQFLQQQPWPGNVRELENVTRKALLSARGYTISVDNVRQALTPPTAPPLPAADQTMAAYVAELLQRAARGELENAQAALTEAGERELYSQAIQLAEGNQAKAGQWLGVSRPTMRTKLTQYGLHPAQDAPAVEPSR
jgi:DNA-binding NtrC family response regulator